MEPARKRRRRESPPRQTASFDYSHFPIGLDETRKLELLPAKSQHDPLTANLLAEDPHGHHEYEALSYTWESEKRPCTINIDSMVLHIGENLAAALRQFRLKTRSRWLWVDAICINQEDPIERTAQVRMMTLIYREATITLSWLGVESEHGDGKATMGFFKWLLLNKQKQRQLQNATNPKKLDKVFREYNATAARSKSPHSTVDVTKLFAFCERRYFTRRWILQEVGVARDSQFYCGKTSINGYDLADAASHLLFHDSPMTISTQFMRFMSLRRPEKYHASSKKQASIEDRRESDEIKGFRAIGTLERFREFDCSDGRDMIAALAWADPRSGLFSVDYGVSIEENYKRFAEDVLAISSECLACALSSAARRPRGGGTELPSWVPSWVPDWRLDPYESAAKLRIVSSHSKGPNKVRLLRQTESSSWKGILEGRALDLSLKDFHESQAVTRDSKDTPAKNLKPGDTVISILENNKLRFDLTGQVRVVVLRSVGEEDSWRIVGALDLIEVKGTEEANLVDVNLRIV